ncbi:MAG TPA: TIM barrel protein [Vicinamibacterales bacterium]|jgi:sugar phosphate isomerase/epimerase
MRLGLDMFSLRSQGWSPFEQLDFAARFGAGVAHYSEIRLLGGLAPDHIRRVRAHADALGIELELGMLSICPSAGIFDASKGAAAEQIAAMLPAAQMLGSPFVRCVVGRMEDRRLPGGIEKRIDDAIGVLRSVRSRVVDAGLKLAIENHAGDLQARELKALVEQAGPDFVGVCVDAGNPLWAIEDPHLTLETLAPYVLTSHVRDSRVWRVRDGTAVAWTRMGEGNIDIAGWIRAFVERCPGRALSLEIIVIPAPTVHRHREAGFWDAYRAMPAWEFDRFEALADGGRPYVVEGAEDPVAREREDVETSLHWTKRFLDQEGLT